MPCYRCGARQSDPVRGPSPWKRGVRAGEQVLVCPDCQQVHDWSADLQHCPDCGSVRLSRALGVTRCGDCGNTWDDTRDESGDEALQQPGPGTDVGSAVTRLQQEVDAAIDRLLRGEGRGPHA